MLTLSLVLKRLFPLVAVILVFVTIIMCINECEMHMQSSPVLPGFRFPHGVRNVKHSSAASVGLADVGCLSRPYCCATGAGDSPRVTQGEVDMQNIRG